MITRKPIQAKSTYRILRAIFPEQFKLVQDKTSNGYKFINLLYGVEIDEARRRLQDLYDNSFLETTDLSEQGELYEVILSGQINNMYLNSTISEAIPIKITNFDIDGDDEFNYGPPTRIINDSSLDISGIVYQGNIVGLEYFRQNPSGNGYFLINTDQRQSEAYMTGSGSTWKISMTNKGEIISYTGLWPGIATQDYSSQGLDDVLTPYTSGYLSNTYPLTRHIKDDSGVYWDIDHYTPYNGWVRDENWNVVANLNYSGDFYYDTEGNKIYYRTAFNNPYGSGNYITEYIRLRNTPISGSLRLYDLDIIDESGNAIEIPSAGKTLYYLQSPNMLNGDATGVWDPKYVGYDQIVPPGQGFGANEGQLANFLATTSWAYQLEGGGIDEGTMQYVESTNGDITNMLKITNPQSRYLAEYKYEQFKRANYITSLNATRHLSLDTPNPTYSLKTVFDNETEVPYKFSKNPNLGSEASRFITFDGWTIRPGSRMSRVDFKVPIMLSSGDLDDFSSIAARRDSIGYTNEFVPMYSPNRRIEIDCPFDRSISLGSVTEQDLTGNGNNFDWQNTGINQIYRLPENGNYGKKIKYLNASGYYTINGTEFLKNNTFFYFKFKAPKVNQLILMELSEGTSNNYIKLSVETNGMISVIGNGTEVYSRYRMPFNNEWKKLILRYYPDTEFTNGNPKFELFINDEPGYTKLKPFEKTVDKYTVSSTFLHLCQNCSIDIDTFKLYYEANYGSAS